MVQLVDAAGRVFGDTGEDIGQPGLGIDVVEFGRDDEAVGDGGMVALEAMPSWYLFVGGF